MTIPATVLNVRAAETIVTRIKPNFVSRDITGFVRYERKTARSKGPINNFKKEKKDTTITAAQTAKTRILMP
jgi:hypothetical protein